MSGWDRHLRGARRATEPADDAVDRLRRRARAAEPSAPRRAPRRWPLAAWGLAVAAVAVVVWRSALPPEPVPDPPIAVSLTGPPGALALSPDVQLAFDGVGAVGGTARAPEIRWTSGRVHVEVAPGRGIALVVETGDARIEVVGTGFDVERSALGTAVSVAHGRVDVRCTDGTRGVLGAGERLVCLPTTAGAWMGRARALAASGAADADVLDAVDRGLARCGDGSPEHGELLVLRLGVLIEADRRDEALATADRYLASGATARLDEVRAIAERLRAR